MMRCLQFVDYNLWNVAIKGRYIPKTNIDGVTTKISSKDLDENDKQLCSMNGEAGNSLYCGSNGDDFNRISMCKNAMEIWDTLEVTLKVQIK